MVFSLKEKTSILFCDSLLVSCDANGAVDNSSMVKETADISSASCQHLSLVDEIQTNNKQVLFKNSNGIV